MTRFDSADRVRYLREGKKVKTPTSYGGLVDEGSFDFTIDYDVERPQRGALIVWAHSAEDGSRIDIREYRVTLDP